MGNPVAIEVLYATGDVPVGIQSVFRVTDTYLALLADQSVMDEIQMAINALHDDCSDIYSKGEVLTQQRVLRLWYNSPHLKAANLRGTVSDMRANVVDSLDYVTSLVQQMNDTKASQADLENIQQAIGQHQVQMEELSRQIPTAQQVQEVAQQTIQPIAQQLQNVQSAVENSHNTLLQDAIPQISQQVRQNMGPQLTQEIASQLTPTVDQRATQAVQNALPPVNSKIDELTNSLAQLQQALSTLPALQQTMEHLKAQQQQQQQQMQQQ